MSLIIPSLVLCCYRSISNNKTTAATGGGAQQHPCLKLLFGTGLALLLLAVAPRSSLADVLTKMNLRSAGGEEQISGLLHEEGPFNKHHVDQFDIKDVNLNDGAAYGNGDEFKSHDESIDDGEDDMSVSLTVSDALNVLVCDVDMCDVDVYIMACLFTHHFDSPI